jgi:SAM-dependent methyltransferase
MEEIRGTARVAKGRDSGMPPTAQWESYFDTAHILDALGVQGINGDAVEFGCGYGTFTTAIAQRISGTVHALDIDPLMVEAARLRVAEAGLRNVVLRQRDFVADGTGIPAESASLALLFNILHIEDAVSLLREARRVLRPGSSVAVIHWNHDARTPRGPPLEIRPRPQQCRAWGEEAGFRWVRDEDLPGSRWHWGMVLARP